jgi:prenyltransferase beta subunit
MNKHKTIEFINNLYSKEDGSFSFSYENKIANLYSTCFAVLVLDLINELNNYATCDKEKIINYINSFQDKKTGLFIDDKIATEFTSHNDEYVHHQLTDFSIITLRSLGSKYKYQLNFLKDYKDKLYLKKWLDDLHWENPWLVSNNIMFILDCLIYEKKFFNFDNEEYINFIMQWLDNNQDAKTGYWNLGHSVSYHDQMAGAYHFLFFYTYLKKKPNHIEQIIDSTLKIQDFDGLFNYMGGGGSCDDLDAIDLLCRSTFYTNYRKKDIKKALQKSYITLWKNQNNDGGFCWAKRDKISLFKIILSINPRLLFFVSTLDFFSNFKSKIFNQVLVLFFKSRLTWKFSGLDKMNIRYLDSDIFSTWFRLLSIAFIEKTFPDICDHNFTFDWNMKQDIGLGYYI